METSTTPRLSKYAKLLVVSDKRRYLEKIEDIGDPYCHESTSLKADILPPVTNTDIFNCFVLTTSFCTGERFKAHKSMDSYKYFVSGFCGNVKGKVIADYFVVVGKVSQPVASNCMT